MTRSGVILVTTEKPRRVKGEGLYWKGFVDGIPVAYAFIIAEWMRRRQDSGYRA